MSLFDRIVARRWFRFWTEHTLDQCRQRVEETLDPKLTAWSDGDDEYRLKKTVPPAMRHLRRPTPPVVRFRLTSAGSGTSITVEGRMDYGELVTSTLLALFLFVGPLLVFIVPTVRDGRPLRPIAPAFFFIIGMPIAIGASAWVGAAMRSSELARRLALVLDARFEQAP